MARNEANIDALQPIQWGWRGGAIDPRMTVSYHTWWTSHRLVPFTDLEQDAPMERHGIGPQGGHSGKGRGCSGRGGRGRRVGGDDGRGGGGRS